MIKYNEFIELFSAARTSRYLSACGNDLHRAQKLYLYNLKLSQSLHPLIGVLEVSLRNKLNTVLSDFFRDANWILNQQLGFMSDPSLFNYKNSNSLRGNFLRSEVNKATNKLAKKRMPVTSSQVIAEQSFSFWTELFETHYYRLLNGKPIKIFKSLPPNIGRREVSEELNRIRILRNRINHNEPICFKGNEINLEGTLLTYSTILNVLKRLSPNIISFTRAIDNFESVVSELRNS